MYRQNYQYNDLLSSASIRLLHLRPAVWRKAPVKCYLQEAQIDEGPEFEALSYVWGAKTGDQPIQCHEKSLLVTSNCLSALQHLRHRFATRVLWVDAICINQTSMAERSAQVKLMGDIYRAAGRVLIWLGEGNASTDALFEELSPVRGLRAMQERYLHSISARGNIFQRKVAARHGDQQVREARTNEVQQSLEPNSHHVNIVGSRPGYAVTIRTKNSESMDPAWQYILDNTWFHRVWTVQEFILASKQMVVCGMRSLEWEIFDRALWKNMSKGKDSTAVLLLMSLKMIYENISDENKSQIVRQVENDGSNDRTTSDDEVTNTDWSYHWSQALLMLATNMRFRLTSNPKDRVYGFHSIARKFGMLLPDPDYDKTLDEIYEDFTFSMINAARSLSILVSFPTSLGRQGSPSWVPDWNCSESPSSEFGFRVSHFSSNERECFATQFTLEHVPGRLRLFGILYEDCTGFGTQIPKTKDRPSSGDSLEHFQPTVDVVLWLYDKLMACKQLPEHPSGTPTLTHFLWSFMRPKQTDDLDNLYEWFNMMVPYIVGVHQCAHDADKRTAWANALDRPELLSMSVNEVFNSFLREPVIQQFLNLVWDKAQFFKGGRSVLVPVGLIGISQVMFQEGDCIALVHGCTEPMILRRVGAAFRLIGFASMRGISKSQGLIQGNKQELQKIDLI